MNLFLKTRAWVCWLVVPSFLTGTVSFAQTNHALNVRTPLVRFTAPQVMAITTNRATAVAPARTTVDLRLPKDFNQYQVVEQHALGTYATTNVKALSKDEVRASVAPGNTLVFLEKNPPAKTAPTQATEQKQLFSTLLIRGEAAKAGQPERSVSGTLTLLADLPVPWDGTSNGYSARLTVMFLTEDPVNNPLLPMTIELRGKNIKNIEPHRVELQRGNPEGSKDVMVWCEAYNPDVEITAYYQMTNTTRELPLQQLTVSSMTQMILSRPMLFAGLTGGFIGGFLRLFKKSKWEVKRMTHYTIEGIVVGVVTVALLLSGLLHNQIAGLPAQPQLVLAFSLAAVAGSVGAHFLDKTVGQLRGKSAS